MLSFEVQTDIFTHLENLIRKLKIYQKSLHESLKVEHFLRLFLQGGGGEGEGYKLGRVEGI